AQLRQPGRERALFPRRGCFQELELDLERGQRLADAVVELARDSAPLGLLDAQDPLGDEAESLLALAEALQEPRVLGADPGHLLRDLAHGVEARPGFAAIRLHRRAPFSSQCG